MNTINQISCTYLTPNKTIEILEISNKDKNLHKVFFIYNYQGISYRVFSSRDQLDGFFNDTDSEEFHFQTEKELDDYLLKVA